MDAQTRAEAHILLGDLRRAADELLARLPSRPCPSCGGPMQPESVRMQRHGGTRLYFACGVCDISSMQRGWSP